MRKGDKGKKVFGVFVILAIIVAVFGGAVSAEDLSVGLKQSVDDAEIQTAVGNLSSEELTEALNAVTDDTVNIEFADQSAEVGVLSSRSSYDPQAAVNYATNYAYKACGCGRYYGSSPPPQGSGIQLTTSGGDCAHFVSHCLAAGGLSNKGTSYATGWCEDGAHDYIISVSKMREWFTNTGIATKVSSVSQLEPGDVIVTNNYGHVVLYIGTYGGNTNRVASHSAWGIFSYTYFGTPNEYWHIITSKACTPKFNIGDAVEVDASPYPCLKVREGPGTGYPDYECEPNGVVGVILDATPISADGYCWVELRYCDGIQGYSVQEGLKDKYIAPSTEFSIGDKVHTSAVLSVRTDPPELTYITVVPEGTIGTILDGPRYGPPEGKSGCYHWWKVQYEGYTPGWSAEDYLEKETPCPHSCWDRSALSGNELAALVRSNFPLGGVTENDGTIESIRVTAYAIARAESGGNPSACGDNDKSIGLWQIHTGYHPEYDKCRLFEEGYNAEAAKQISTDGSDWNPWCTWEKSACGGNGNEAYKQYLTEARKHFYPKVTSLSVSQTSINLGEAVKIYYSVSDDVGLDRVELLRTTDKSGNPDEFNWKEVKRVSISGTIYSSYFDDSSHDSPGVYWYGIHVVDNSGAPEAWNDEKNSRTGGSPGVFGPIRVEVSSTQRTITFYTDPIAGGTITFDGSIYSNGLSTTKTDGSYSVSANPASNYEFDHWSTTGSVSVANLYSQSTTATVSGDGSIKAWFNIPSECDGTATSCGIYPNCENCNEDDSCYPSGDGCEERNYYCVSNEAGCSYTYSNRHTDYYDDWDYYCDGDTVRKHRLFHNYYCDGGTCTDHPSLEDDQLVENCNDHDGWVDTGNTDWAPDPGNDCQEKEQKEQKYRDYYCSGGACTYSLTGTQWVDTGTTQNKDDGTICDCTASNTLKRCYGGVCTDTGICDATTCGADVACNGKEPGDSCDGGGTCDSNCKCGVSAVGEDIAVYIDRTFYISTNLGTSGEKGVDLWYNFGLDGAKPLVGDFNRDGDDDIAVYIDRTFYISTNLGTSGEKGVDLWYNFGLDGAKPLVGDFNRDGYDDIAVYIGRTFYINTNLGTSGEKGVDLWYNFGLDGAKPLVGDFNRDGYDDIAVYIDRTFYISTNLGTSGEKGVDLWYNFGVDGAKPLVGDFNRDGYDDIAVYIDRTFYISTNLGTSGEKGVDLWYNFGVDGAKPLVGDLG